MPLRVVFHHAADLRGFSQQLLRQAEQTVHHAVQRSVGQDAHNQPRPKATGEVSHEVEAAEREDGIAVWFDRQQQQVGGCQLRRDDLRFRRVSGNL